LIRTDNIRSRVETKTLFFIFAKSESKQKFAHFSWNFWSGYTFRWFLNPDPHSKWKIFAKTFAKTNKNFHDNFCNFFMFFFAKSEKKWQQIKTLDYIQLEHQMTSSDKKIWHQIKIPYKIRSKYQLTLSDDNIRWHQIKPSDDNIRCQNQITSKW
jgi:hypothetical protein